MIVKKQKEKTVVCWTRGRGGTKIKLKNEVNQEMEEFNYLGSRIMSDKEMLRR